MSLAHEYWVLSRYFWLCLHCVWLHVDADHSHLVQGRCPVSPSHMTQCAHCLHTALTRHHQNWTGHADNTVNEIFQWHLQCWNKIKKAKLKKLKPSILIYLCSNIYIIQKNVTHFSFLFTPELIFTEDNAMWIPLFKVSLAHFNSNEEDFIILYPHGFDCDLGDNGEWWRKEDRNLQYTLHSFEILQWTHTTNTVSTIRIYFIIISFSSSNRRTHLHL